jgi:hypothetical protein
VHRGPWATLQWNSTEAKELPTFRIEGLLNSRPPSGSAIQQREVTA